MFRLLLFYSFVVFSLDLFSQERNVDSIIDWNMRNGFFKELNSDIRKGKIIVYDSAFVEIDVFSLQKDLPKYDTVQVDLVEKAKVRNNQYQGRFDGHLIEAESFGIFDTTMLSSSRIAFNFYEFDPEDIDRINLPSYYPQKYIIDLDSLYRLPYCYLERNIEAIKGNEVLRESYSLLLTEKDEMWINDEVILCTPDISVGECNQKYRIRFLKNLQYRHSYSDGYGVFSDEGLICYPDGTDSSEKYYDANGHSDNVIFKYVLDSYEGGWMIRERELILMDIYGKLQAEFRIVTISNSFMELEYDYRILNCSYVGRVKMKKVKVQD